MEATTIAVHFEDQRSELDISRSPITSLKDLLDRCRDLFRFPPDANLTVGFKDDGDDGQIKNDRFAKTVQAGDELEIRTGGASQVLNLRVVQPAGKEVSVLVMMTSTIQSTLDSSPGMFMHNESKAPSLIDKTFLDLLELFQCDRRELEKAVYIKQALPNQTQERRAQTKKEVAARLDECNNLRADLQKKVSEGAAAEEAETLKTVDKLKAKYSTFSDQRFDEMAKRGMDSMTTELTKLASILKVDLQALECDPPDASTRCQELFKLLYLPGVADPQLSHPVLDRLYHTLEQTFASSSERVAHEQGGYAGSSSVAHRVEACGGFMGFGAAGGHAHTEAWGRNDGFGQGQRRLSTQATVSKTQVFQLLSFIVERVTLDHGARNVLSQLGRLADTELQGQERLVKEFLDRYNQMFYLGVPQGPFSVGGSFEMYSTSSTQSVQDFTQLVTAAQQVNNNSWDVAVSGLTSSFAGSGGAAGVTNVQLNVGSGNDNQGNQTFAQVTTLVNIQGPTATNQHDVERSLMANINTGVLVPNSKPKRTLVFQDVALATEESMEPHERAAFVKGVERLNAFVHARTPVLTLDLGKGDAAVNTILFGKTGHGKSLLGSILLGWKPGDHPPFQSSDNTNSCTRGIARGRAGNLTVWDSQGLQDTTFSVLQLVENHKPFLEEFVKTLVSIGGDGVDALLYVINEARVDAKDGETAQMLAKFFQGGNIQQHTYLIFTRSDNPHRNKDQWLDTNCQNNPHFKAVYELVGCDPSHTIFIDSKNYVNTTRMEDRNSWAQQNNESLLRIQEMICTTRPIQILRFREEERAILIANLTTELENEQAAANADPDTIKKLKEELAAERKKMEDNTAELSKCFAGDSTVQTKSRGPIQLQDLSIGDHVLDGDGEWTQVITWLHKEPDQDMNCIQLSHLHGTVSASYAHLIFVQDHTGCQCTKPMQEVQVGDLLFGLDNTPSPVTRVSVALKHGVFSPLTAAGHMMVDGAKASNYVEVCLDVPKWGVVPIRSHAFLHASCAPIRAYNYLKSWVVHVRPGKEEDGYHPSHGIIRSIIAGVGMSLSCPPNRIPEDSK